ESRDRILGEGGCLGGGHAGFRILAEAGEQSQDASSLEAHLDVLRVTSGPEFEGPPKVGGSLGGLAGTDPGPAPKGMTVAESTYVFRALRICVSQFLEQSPAGFER